MKYDLVVRGGTVVDGSGRPGYEADVGIVGQRIAEIGKISQRGSREVDASGHCVTPGFVDGHTHMDAQVFWDPLGTCSSWHGVTTAVMGNCGFTLAPSKEDERELVLRNLERSEDISAAAMNEGINWSWTTFRTFLDALEQTSKGINYAAYVGHSALRTWAMGERAFDGASTEDDLRLMERELGDALAAGAIGFTTSRSEGHMTSDGRPVASCVADWSEVVRLVDVVGRSGRGVFELALEQGMKRSPDAEARAKYYAQLLDLAVSSRVPMTFGVQDQMDTDPECWRDQLRLFDAAAARGAKIFGQSNCQEMSVLLSFRSGLPFDKLAEWRDFRSLSIPQQQDVLRDPQARANLVHWAKTGSYGTDQYGAEPKKPDYSRIRLLTSMTGDNPTIQEIARRENKDPVDVMIDAALDTDFNQFFAQVLSNMDRTNHEEILRHPRAVMTFSDSGAHVSQVMGSSIHTHLLAEWVRSRETFTLEQAVRMITLEPAVAWGFADRGLLREGFAADINVIDPATVEPRIPVLANDLPAGAQRLIERPEGIRYTIVGGEVLFDDGEHTGCHPGQLLRRVA